MDNLNLLIIKTLHQNFPYNCLIWLYIFYFDKQLVYHGLKILKKSRFDVCNIFKMFNN